MRFVQKTQVRYVAIGVFNTVFGFATFVFLQKTMGRYAHYLAVLLLAHITSVLLAFVGYRTFVFRVQGQMFADLIRFWSVYAVVLGGNLLALPFLVEVFDLPVILAQGVFTGLMATVSYVAHERFSFKRASKADT